MSYEDFDDCDDECPNCGGEGVVYMCEQEFACIDPEGGCDLCERRCDWCRGTPKKQAPDDLRQVLADALKAQREAS